MVRIGRIVLDAAQVIIGTTRPWQDLACQRTLVETAVANVLEEQNAALRRRPRNIDM